MRRDNCFVWDRAVIILVLTNFPLGFIEGSFMVLLSKTGRAGLSAVFRVSAA